jgi:hypothetical protein
LIPGIGGKLRLYWHVSAREPIVKKGRHRRFEEARDLKRAVSTDETTAEPCAECGAEPGTEHASWCLATEDDDFDEDEEDEEAAEYNPSDSR